MAETLLPIHQEPAENPLDKQLNSVAVSGVAPFRVGIQRTVQRNGNVKSEPKYLAHEESTCFHDRGVMEF